MSINGAKTKIMSSGAGTDDDQPAITPIGASTGGCGSILLSGE